LLLALLFTGLLMGAGKAGVKGLSMLVVPVLAGAFGSKASTGVLLPILICADLLAVRYYRRDVIWPYLFRLLPAAVGGVLVATWIGEAIDESTFRFILAIIVLGSLLLLLYLERFPVKPERVKHPAFGITTGLLGGFCTMIGNAAGPVMSVYLLSVRLPKNAFIGTAAYFFMFINLFKLPFHIFAWGTIDAASLRYSLWAVPAILLGFWLGIKLVSRIPEREFRYFIMLATGIAALKLLFWS